MHLGHGARTKCKLQHPKNSYHLKYPLYKAEPIIIVVCRHCCNGHRGVYLSIGQIMNESN